MKKLILVLISLFLVVGCGTDLGDYDEISLEKFHAMIEEKQNFILYMGYEGCHYCQEFSPKLRKIIKKYDLDIKFLDVDSQKLTEEEYDNIENITSLSGTPTVVFVKEGKVKLFPRMVGNMDEDVIIKNLKDNGYID